MLPAGTTALAAADSAARNTVDSGLATGPTLPSTERQVELLWSSATPRERSSAAVASCSNASPCARADSCCPTRTMISSSATCRAGCIGVICGCIGVPMVCAMVAAIAAGIAFGSETGSPACMRAAAWMLCALCIGGSIAPPSGTIAAPAAPIDAGPPRPSSALHVFVRSLMLIPTLRSACRSRSAISKLRAARSASRSWTRWTISSSLRRPGSTPSWPSELRQMRSLSLISTPCSRSVCRISSASG
mmetsp:Transcript_13682/g.28865  ORF Transcript_13682/g.28865 Transcript_13682/m.28865 type:complete len:247 (-) Transcript_13682:383-1123(-)